MSITSFENPLVTSLQASSARRKRRLANTSSMIDALMATRATGGGVGGGVGGGSSLQRAASKRVGTSSLSAPPIGGSGVVSKILQFGMAQRGTPYRWGGSAPGGFDCSGLVQYIYGKYGIKLPRTSREQSRVGIAVPAAQARAGDLVVWNLPGRHHVGVYLGNGKYLNAPHTGDVVKIAPVNLAGATIRRVV